MRVPQTERPLQAGYLLELEKELLNENVDNDEVKRLLQILSLPDGNLELPQKVADLLKLVGLRDVIKEEVFTVQLQRAAEEVLCAETPILDAQAQLALRVQLAVAPLRGETMDLCAVGSNIKAHLLCPAPATTCGTPSVLLSRCMEKAARDLLIDLGYNNAADGCSTAVFAMRCAMELEKSDRFRIYICGKKVRVSRMLVDSVLRQRPLSHALDAVEAALARVRRSGGWAGGEPSSDGPATPVGPRSPLRELHRSPGNSAGEGRRVIGGEPQRGEPTAPASQEKGGSAAAEADSDLSGGDPEAGGGCCQYRMEPVLASLSTGRCPRPGEGAAAAIPGARPSPPQAAAARELRREGVAAWQRPRPGLGPPPEGLGDISLPQVGLHVSTKRSGRWAAPPPEPSSKRKSRAPPGAFLAHKLLQRVVDLGAGGARSTGRRAAGARPAGSVPAATRDTPAAVPGRAPPASADEAVAHRRGSLAEGPQPEPTDPRHGLRTVKLKELVAMLAADVESAPAVPELVPASFRQANLQARAAVRAARKRSQTAGGISEIEPTLPDEPDLGDIAGAVKV